MKMKNLVNASAVTALAATALMNVGCSNRDKAGETGELKKQPSALTKNDGGAKVAAATMVQKSVESATANAGSAPSVTAGSSATATGPSVLARPVEAGTETILANASTDCLACARDLQRTTLCDLPSIACETARDGKDREQCLDTLRCVLPGKGQESCVNKANSDLTKCYCGTATVEACLTPGNANGKCKAKIETGLGSTDPGYVARNITDRKHSSGAAMKIAQCMADAGRLVDPRCKACF